MTVLASPSDKSIVVDNSNHGIKERRAIDILAPFTVIHAKLRAIRVRSGNGHNTGMICSATAILKFNPSEPGAGVCFSAYVPKNKRPALNIVLNDGAANSGAAQFDGLLN